MLIQLEQNEIQVSYCITMFLCDDQIFVAMFTYDVLRGNSEFRI